MVAALKFFLSSDEPEKDSDDSDSDDVSLLKDVCHYVLILAMYLTYHLSITYYGDSFVHFVFLVDFKDKPSVKEVTMANRFNKKTRKRAKNLQKVKNDVAVSIIECSFVIVDCHNITFYIKIVA